MKGILQIKMANNLFAQRIFLTTSICIGVGLNISNDNDFKSAVPSSSS